MHHLFRLCVSFDIMSGGLTTIRLYRRACGLGFSALERTEVRTTSRFCYGNRPD